MDDFRRTEKPRPQPLCVFEVVRSQRGVRLIEAMWRKGASEE